MKKGILLPIFSLPSNYGIGDFGNEAYEFIDILSENKIDYWEILPINDCYDSPYSPISYYALNINYVSIDKLKDIGLVHNAIFKPKSSRITYDNFKEKYYIEAYNNFIINDEFNEFIKDKNIYNYALYMSSKYNRDVNYYLFLQYILNKQYFELKSYAEKKNVKIIGDMPIYPDYNSSEVKFNSKYYQLNNGNMEYVSGASPDYFDSYGQKWGHPLYNFNNIKSDNYNYFIERYKCYLKYFDIFRIDHFRAFDSYFKIPINSLPKDGFYEKGPGEELLNEIFKFSNSSNYIVEDLGSELDNVIKLRDRYNLMGMKILEYTLDVDNMKDNYPDTQNMIFYTGNHDNNTIMGWYNNLSNEQKENVVKFLNKNNIHNDSINESLITYVKNSIASIIMIPVQDILGLDENSRINLPGKVCSNNWSFELLDFDEFKKKISIMK